MTGETSGLGGGETRESQGASPAFLVMGVEVPFTKRGRWRKSGCKGLTMS